MSLSGRFGDISHCNLSQSLVGTNLLTRSPSQSLLWTMQKPWPTRAGALADSRRSTGRLAQERWPTRAGALADSRRSTGRLAQKHWPTRAEALADSRRSTGRLAQEHWPTRAEVSGEKQDVAPYSNCDLQELCVTAQFWNSAGRRIGSRCTPGPNIRAPVKSFLAHRTGSYCHIPMCHCPSIRVEICNDYSQAV